MSSGLALNVKFACATQRRRQPLTEIQFLSERRISLPQTGVSTLRAVELLLELLH